MRRTAGRSSCPTAGTSSSCRGAPTVTRRFSSRRSTAAPRPAFRIRVGGHRRRRLLHLSCATFRRASSRRRSIRSRSSSRPARRGGGRRQHRLTGGRPASRCSRRRPATLVYATGKYRPSQLTWFNRTGQRARHGRRGRRLLRSDAVARRRDRSRSRSAMPDRRATDSGRWISRAARSPG